MLKVSHLVRCYDDVKAVDDVTFSINRGEIVGLLGHNGAGKTTVMKIISGYLEPNEGAVSVDEIDLSVNPKAIQQQLGYLPESLPLYPEMSVADYLDYAAALKGLKKSHKSAEIARVVEATDIANKFLAPISTLSRGYKQRVGVAQAILGRPKLLILDEPTNGLDPKQTQYMRELIRELATDATVILSTHIMQEVDALCSRALILRSGRLVVDSQLDDLRHSRDLLLTSSLPVAEMPKLQALKGIARVIHMENEDIENKGIENEATESPDKRSQEKEKQEGNETTARKVNHYRITLQAAMDRHAVGATLAKYIVETGEDIYTLQREHRSLETLFRQVNEENYRQEGIDVAA